MYFHRLNPKAKADAHFYNFLLPFQQYTNDGSMFSNNGLDVCYLVSYKDAFNRYHHDLVTYWFQVESKRIVHNRIKVNTIIGSAWTELIILQIQKRLAK